jgi:hypothetical protein
MKDAIGEWITVMFFVTALYVLVRPRSKGAEFVKAFGTAMTSIVKNAADLGSA